MRLNLYSLLFATLLGVVACQHKAVDPATNPTDANPDWTTTSHGKDAEPNYSTVFPQNQVNTLEITMTTADWTAIRNKNEAMLTTGGGAKAVSLGMTEVAKTWPLIRYVADDAVYYARYKQYVKEFNDNVFATTKIQALFDQYTNLIIPFVNDTEKEQRPYSHLSSTAAFTSALPTLKQHVVMRNQAVKDFLK